MLCAPQRKEQLLTRYLWQATQHVLTEMGASDGIIKVFKDICHLQEYLDTVHDEKIGPQRFHLLYCPHHPHPLLL